MFLPKLRIYCENCSAKVKGFHWQIIDKKIPKQRIYYREFSRKSPEKNYKGKFQEKIIKKQDIVCPGTIYPRINIALEA
jgi:hypothetical protein